MGWGGKRQGSGRKPKPKPAVDAPARVLAHPSVPTTNEPSPIEEFDAPDSLDMESRKVWLSQAPHAFRQRTLTRSTALAFERYCQAVVWAGKEAESSARGGANHRGLLKQIHAYEHDFLLAPSGKAMAEAGAGKPEAPASKLSAFRR
jgi:hypothetical protein